MAILLVSIGNRDVGVRKDIVPEHIWDKLKTFASKPKEGKGDYLLFSDLREAGRVLSKWLAAAKDASALDEVFNAIDLPIIEPLIEVWKERVGNSKEDVLIKAYGFHSDQQGGYASPEHVKSDTVNFAPVIKAVLEHRVKEKLGVGSFTYQPAVLSGGSIAHYDFVIPKLDEKLKAVQREHSKQKAIVLPEGGTPQLTTALIICSVRHFETRCSVFYVNPKGTLGERVQAADVSKVVLKDAIGRALEEAINSYQYTAATRLLELRQGNYQALFKPYSKMILSLLDIGHRRLCFDFKRALKSLAEFEEACSSTSSDQGEFIEECRTELEERIEAMSTGDEVTDVLIKELYYVADIKKRRREYVDFILYYNALIKNILIYIFEKLCGKRMVAEAGDLELGVITRDATMVKQYKRSNYPECIHICDVEDKERDLSKAVYNTLYNILGKKGRIKCDGKCFREDVAHRAEIDPEKLEKFISFYKHTTMANSKLAKLRNQCIGTHSFTPVSEENLRYAYKNDVGRCWEPRSEEQLENPAESMINDIQRICNWFGIKVTKNESPFTKLNARLLMLINLTEPSTLLADSSGKHNPPH